MSVPTPFEHRLLRGAIEALSESVARVRLALPRAPDARLLVLEAAAAEIAGFPVDAFWPAERRELGPVAGILRDTGAFVADAVRAGAPSHPSLALATLATPELEHSDQRRNGVYYTDSRLARHLAARSSEALRREALWLDPACGTGILLVAAVLEVGGEDPQARQALVMKRVHGADLSSDAVRGARLALASLCADARCLGALDAHLVVADSLLGREALWADRAPDGFGVVLGNPPWEKLKVSRHEFLKAQGVLRHYGAEYDRVELAALESEKERLATYIAAVTHGLTLQGTGEADLFKCFIELAFLLLRRDGVLAYVIPAGLIRSKGTEALRQYLIRSSQDIEVDVLENRARFFAIDSRAKFLVLIAASGTGPARFTVRDAVGSDTGIEVRGAATFAAENLRRIRPDLTVPEVRSQREWQLFQHAFDTGHRLDGSGESPWHLSIAREVDMTNHRRHFVRDPGEEDVLPVVEGRMVHQFHFGAKRYEGGTGRRARWSPQLPVDPEVRPQFWIARRDLPGTAEGRVDRVRIGFCDVTGQTNERSMLAAMVPAGVACGNKVPTVTLEGFSGQAEDRAWLWLAVANSFTFDWLLRRVVTTSVNFFLLRGMVFPAFSEDPDAWRPLAQRARFLGDPGSGGAPGSSSDAPWWSRAEARAAIDVEVALAYGFDVQAMEVMLDDFALLDRGQPALPGEDRSTLTRDLLLLRLHERVGGGGALRERLTERVEGARQLGALPFVPSELAEHVRGRGGVEGAA